jgi:disulfide bond formation protein DsbB
MFPLVFLLLAALFPLQSNTPRFVMPLSISGSLVALYHLFLYYGVIPASYSPCREGASCLTRFFEFGIISIPLLSFLSFLLITMLVIFSHKGLAREK